MTTATAAASVVVGGPAAPLASGSASLNGASNNSSSSSSNSNNNNQDHLHHQQQRASSSRPQQQQQVVGASTVATSNQAASGTQMATQSTGSSCSASNNSAQNQLPVASNNQQRHSRMSSAPASEYLATSNAISSSTGPSSNASQHQQASAARASSTTTTTAPTVSVARKRGRRRQQTIPDQPNGLDRVFIWDIDGSLVRGDTIAESQEISVLASVADKLDALSKRLKQTTFAFCEENLFLHELEMSDQMHIDDVPSEDCAKKLDPNNNHTNNNSLASQEQVKQQHADPIVQNGAKVSQPMSANQTASLNRCSSSSGSSSRSSNSSNSCSNGINGNTTSVLKTSNSIHSPNINSRAAHSADTQVQHHLEPEVEFKPNVHQLELTTSSQDSSLASNNLRMGENAIEVATPTSEPTTIATAGSENGDTTTHIYATYQEAVQQQHHEPNDIPDTNQYHCNELHNTSGNTNTTTASDITSNNLSSLQENQLASSYHAAAAAAAYNFQSPHPDPQFQQQQRHSHQQVAAQVYDDLFASSHAHHSFQQPDAVAAQLPIHQPAFYTPPPPPAQPLTTGGQPTVLVHAGSQAADERSSGGYLFEHHQHDQQQPTSYYNQFQHHHHHHQQSQANSTEQHAVASALASATSGADSSSVLHPLEYQLHGPLDSSVYATSYEAGGGGGGGSATDSEESFHQLTTSVPDIYTSDALCWVEAQNQQHHHEQHQHQQQHHHQHSSPGHIHMASGYGGNNSVSSNNRGHYAMHQQHHLNHQHHQHQPDIHQLQHRHLAADLHHPSLSQGYHHHSHLAHHNQHQQQPQQQQQHQQHQQIAHHQYHQHQQQQQQQPTSQQLQLNHIDSHQLITQAPILLHEQSSGIQSQSHLSHHNQQSQALAVHQSQHLHQHHQQQLPLNHLNHHHHHHHAHHQHDQQQQQQPHLMHHHQVQNHHQQPQHLHLHHHQQHQSMHLQQPQQQQHQLHQHQHNPQHQQQPPLQHNQRPDSSPTATLRTVLNNHHKQLTQRLSIRFHRIRNVYNLNRNGLKTSDNSNNPIGSDLPEILAEIDHYTLDWRKRAMDCLRLISESPNCTNIIITKLPLVIALGHLVCLDLAQFFEVDQVYSASKTNKEACLKRIRKRFGTTSRCTYIIVGDKDDVELAKRHDLPSWNTSRSDGHKQLVQLYTALKEGYLM